MAYLKKLIPRAHVGHEMVDSQLGALELLISNPTSASETTVLSKTPKEIPQNRPQSLCKRRVI